MHASFARFTAAIHALRRTSVTLAVGALLGMFLTGCATLPPPTGEIDAAQAAVSAASAADAEQYAPDDLALARDALGRAQAAISVGDDDAARRFAAVASAAGDLARARSRATVAESSLAERTDAIAELGARLGVPTDGGMQPMPGLPEPGASDTEGGLAQRLALLEADVALRGLAAYEQLRARQALDALVEARRGDRDDARLVASLRVRAAEFAARAEAMQARAASLELEHSRLMVEASRRDAELARQEAARLRVAALVRAAEAARLRVAAAPEAAARQATEDVLDGVAGEQAARLRAAREREAELARQEAELLREAEEAEASGDL